uniref:(California timema) hypothetical protein n=1 Tax=Timema californicum TaxID=61474 RepID=A0A7R9J0U7_TIMCA|nr:unnamed protein product [Timema californicum]
MEIAKVPTTYFPFDTGEDESSNKTFQEATAMPRMRRGIGWQLEMVLLLVSALSTLGSVVAIKPGYGHACDLVAVVSYIGSYEGGHTWRPATDFKTLSWAFSGRNDKYARLYFLWRWPHLRSCRSLSREHWTLVRNKKKKKTRPVCYTNLDTKSNRRAPKQKLIKTAVNKQPQSNSNQ